MLRGAPLVLSIFLLSCAPDKAPPGFTVRRSDLYGSWTRPIRGMEGDEGYEFRPDSSLALINIHSMTGERWYISGNDTLTVETSTERYPAPNRRTYRIVSLTESTLVLALPGAEVGYTEVYRRRK